MITLRPAEPTDAEAVASLLTEVDRYYGATEEEPLAQRLPLIRSALFETPQSAYALLAWEEDHLVGLAAYSFLWPAAGVTRSVYLKELYVSEPSRKRGVGHLLMSELCRVARDNGCDRVEWTADADNPIALSFYSTLGVPPESSKVFYRLAGDAMAQMADSVSLPGARS
jgi:GNAT superfamily N-acetyltransferase